MSHEKASEGEHLLSDAESGLSPDNSRKRHGFLCGDMFPTFSTFIIFIAYITLFVNQGILVTATKNGKSSYDYSIVAVVLLTEFGKLLSAIIIFLFQQRSLLQLITEIKTNYKLCLWYFVPAGLYCLYNNLSFVNLAWYDPTTYFILLQIRVLLTGVTFQIVFRKRLTVMQWFSLVVLTLGCVIKQLSFTVSDNTKHDHSKNSSFTAADVSSSSPALPIDWSSFIWRSFFNVHFLLMLTQLLCSCFAGVYNEYLLKEKGNSADVMVQNVFMYFDSCICNILVLFYFGGGAGTEVSEISVLNSWTDSLSSVVKPLVICIILNNCAGGIVTSVFLKYLNSVVKVYASALELGFTAVLSWILFGIPINLPTAIAIVVISAAIYLYTVNPVVNLPKTGVNTSPRHSTGVFKSGKDVV